MNYFNQLTQHVKSQSPVLYNIVLANFYLAIICLVGMFIDDRTLAGINVWTKPFKFCISTGIYILTFGYFVSLFPFSKRKKRFLNGFVAWTLLLELLIIIVQGARGVQSHYNQSSLYDALAYAGMGVLIGLNVLIMLFMLVETIRTKMNVDKSVQWGMFLGWVIIIIGSYVGGQMISQLSHNVGVADGGAGIPILNWSTKGGDLRIAHFFGIHGLQIIPLFAFWTSKKWAGKNINQIILTTLFALLYAGIIGFVFYQAKQGMPITSSLA